MGKGGSSSSSNSTSNTNVNGTNAVSGDNLGVLLSGVSKSTVNVTATDHGSVKAAKDIAEKSIEKNSDVAKRSLDFGEETLSKAMNFGEKSLTSAQKANESAIDAVKSMAAQSNENARAALSMAENAKTNEQAGVSPEMTKIALGVAAAFAVSAVALSYGRS